MRKGRQQFSIKTAVSLGQAAASGQRTADSGQRTADSGQRTNDTLDHEPEGFHLQWQIYMALEIQQSVRLPAAIRK